MAIANVNDLAVQALGEIYDAEHQFLEGQQELKQQATDQDLKSSIQQHISDTEQHIWCRRLKLTMHRTDTICREH